MLDKKIPFDNLTAALCTITDPLLMRVFLTDIMTPKELEEISARLQAAVMLKEGQKYTAIIDATGLSSRTVARISEWLKKDSGGYSAAITSLENHHSHI